MKIKGDVYVFNTKRQYTANGQRILYAFIEGDGVPPNTVVFYDIDRSIDGSFIAFKDTLSQEEIMLHYDRNTYNNRFSGRDLLMDTMAPKHDDQ